MNFVTRLFARAEPTVSEARQRDAAVIAGRMRVSFQRGWGEDEVHRLLIERNVVAHRVTVGRAFAGFILSRLAAGGAGDFLDRHCAGLAGPRFRASAPRFAYPPPGRTGYPRDFSGG